MNCQINEPPFHQCCCFCTMQKEVVTNIGGQHVGYVCTLRDELQNDNKYIWQSGEHSQGCEMFKDKRQ